MDKLLVGVLLLSVLLFGCVINSSEKSSEEKTVNNSLNVKTITISGDGQTQEIFSETPVKLVVSGINNTVTVKEGTSVQEILVSGIDVKIKLPRGATPKITDSGLRTQITYN